MSLWQNSFYMPVNDEDEENLAKRQTNYKNWLRQVFRMHCLFSNPPPVVLRDHGNQTEEVGRMQTRSHIPEETSLEKSISAGLSVQQPETRALREQSTNTAPVGMRSFASKHTAGGLQIDARSVMMVPPGSKELQHATELNFVASGQMSERRLVTAVVRALKEAESIRDTENLQSKPTVNFQMHQNAVLGRQSSPKTLRSIVADPPIQVVDLPAAASPPVEPFTPQPVKSLPTVKPEDKKRRKKKSSQSSSSDSDESSDDEDEDSSDVTSSGSSSTPVKKKKPVKKKVPAKKKGNEKKSRADQPQSRKETSKKLTFEPQKVKQRPSLQPYAPAVKKSGKNAFDVRPPQTNQMVNFTIPPKLSNSKKSPMAPIIYQGQLRVPVVPSERSDLKYQYLRMKEAENRFQIQKMLHTTSRMSRKEFTTPRTSSGKEVGSSPAAGADGCSSFKIYVLNSSTPHAAEFFKRPNESPKRYKAFRLRQSLCIPQYRGRFSTKNEPTRIPILRDPRHSLPLPFAHARFITQQQQRIRQSAFSLPGNAQPYMNGVFKVIPAHVLNSH